MTVTENGRADGAGIDSERMAVCLSVLEELDALPLDHPDAIAIRRATAGIYRMVKQRRRQERRAAKTANDKAVTEATATGAADRIDDETLGLALTSSVTTEIAGILQRPRSCYICKSRYVEVDAFYHQLCRPCAQENRARRDARTDLTGRRALLTGGRAKIGMYIALRLLRDGAHTTITTRFPNDAVRRFKAMPDSAEWLHRLKIVGIDLRDPAQVVALADSVSAEGPLDILINNAAQTVRRSPRRTAQLVAAESAPLPAGELPASEVIGDFGSGAPAALPAASAAGAGALTAEDVTALALASGSASLARIEAGTAIDAGGLVPDLDATQQLDPDGGRGRPGRAAGSPAVQYDRAVRAGEPAAPGDGGGRGPAQVRGERLRDGGPVQPRLQGRRPSAHQHGQGRAEHAHPHQRPGDAGRPTAS